MEFIHWHLYPRNMCDRSDISIIVLTLIVIFFFWNLIISSHSSGLATQWLLSAQFLRFLFLKKNNQTHFSMYSICYPTFKIGFIIHLFINYFKLLHDSIYNSFSLFSIIIIIIYIIGIFKWMSIYTIYLLSYWI